jgi:MFS family permease
MSQDMNRRLDIAAWVTVLAATLSGAVARSWAMDFAPNPDEALHLVLASYPSLGTVVRAIVHEFHPPISYIIDHYLFYVSNGVGFHRLASFIPGVLCVPAGFALGKRCGGRVTGVVLAILASSSIGLIVQSQVVRAYALLVLATLVALEALLAWVAERQRSAAWRYAIALAVVVGSHYSGWIAAGSIAGAWIFEHIAARRPLRDYRTLVVMHVPAGVVALLSFAITLRHMLPGRSTGFTEVARWQTDNLRHGPQDLIPHAAQAMSYLFWPDVGWLALGLGIIGLAILWQHQRLPALAAGLALALACVASAIGVYPLSAARYSLYLFPFVAMGVAEAIATLLRRSAVLPTIRDWRVLLVAGAIVGMAAGLIPRDLLPRMRVTAEYGPYIQPDLYMELAELESLLDAVHTSVGHDDAVLMNSEAANYVAWLAGGGATINDISRELRRVDWEGRPFYFARTWTFSPTKLEAARVALRDAGVCARDHLWLLHLGWPDETLADLRSTGTSVAANNRVGFLVSFDAKTFLACPPR